MKLVLGKKEAAAVVAVAGAVTAAAAIARGTNPFRPSVSHTASSSKAPSPLSFMPNQSINMSVQQFETVLSHERFKPLKAILDSLSSDRQNQCEALNSSLSYEDLLGRLGYRLALIKQIHVQAA